MRGRAAARARDSGVSTGKVEVQVEISSPWRYTAIIVLTIPTTQDLTRSEIVSREIDPALFYSHQLSTDNFLALSCSNGTLGYCRVSCAINNKVVKLVFGLPSIPHRFRSVSHSVPYRYWWRSMIGHTDGSVLNDDSECPGCGSRTPAVRARSSWSQPVAVGCAAGRPG